LTEKEEGIGHVVPKPRILLLQPLSQCFQGWPGGKPPNPQGKKATKEGQSQNGIEEGKIGKESSYFQGKDAPQDDQYKTRRQLERPLKRSKKLKAKSYLLEKTGQTAIITMQTLSEQRRTPK
jgi:hypothetical protein